ncbi:MAG: hypothetical protein FJ404_09905 [Verrucomicrobia bacterium]|nr:hypothetical protein [Verrucomicrobiota bacterium]
MPPLETAGSRIRDTAPTAIPWFIYLAAIGVTGIPVGVLWDISWHSTIGRDTFWTPAHLCIHAGGLIPGLTCIALILRLTFWGTDREKAGAVRIWGFHGPLGAWVVVWGNLAMLTSAPFDDWWHDAYGLDVEIISPPHSVLALGMFGVALGVLLLVLACQNNIEESKQARASLLFNDVAGVLITMLAIMMTEETFPNQQHSGLFYGIIASTFPVYLALISRASKGNWGATRSAAIYMGIMAGALWILPLFRGQPMLAPIYSPVTHMVPPAFPLLLILPAALFDLLIQRFGKGRIPWWRVLLLAIPLGALFVGTMLPAQWHFSKFLISDSAQNRFFAGRAFYPYFSRPGPYQKEFWLRNRSAAQPKDIALAAGLGIAASAVGLGIGGWMTRVRR